MPGKKSAEPFSAAEAFLNAYATNDRINHYLIQNLPDLAWRAKLPGGKGRDVASMFAHMHNVRLMWLKSAAPDSKVPAKLEGETFTKADAMRALEISQLAMRDVLANALNGDGRIRGFKPDVASFLAYLLAHDAHHRGQISMLARLLGHALPQSAMYGMWEWGTR